MRTIMIAAGSAALVAAMPLAADDHDDYMLDITTIEVKLGHNMHFREGVKAYMDCYAKAGGESGWGTWANMDGEGIVYHLVSLMDSWADLDESDEAAMGCWSVVEEQIAPHMKSVSTMYAQRMPEWSRATDPEFSVVRLHNFSVDKNQKFRAAIGTVTGILKASKSENMGTWYEIKGGGVDDPEYFVVEYYENFAAMDEERDGPYGTMEKHAGEATADLVWGEYLDSLENGEAYWSNLMKYDEELSHSVE